MNRSLFLFSLGFVASFCHLGSAQPPDAPSTINAAPAPIFRGPIVPPDPPTISPEALQTLLGGATTVTFKAQNASLQTVLKALLANTNIQPSRIVQGGEELTLSVDWQAKPFWSAAAEVENLSGRIWDGRYGDGLALSRFADTSGLGFGGLIGAQSPLVTLVAGSVSRSSNRTRILGQKPPKTPRPDRDYVQIALTAYFDPKLTVQSTTLRALKFVAKGQNQPRIGDEIRSNYGSLLRANSPMLSLSLPLPADTAPATHFSSIRGTLHCVVVAKTEPFNVPDVLATPQISKQAGAQSHNLLGAEVDGSQLTLRLSPATGETRAPRVFSPFPANFFSTLRVRDGAGQELPRLGNSSTGTRTESSFRFRIKTPKGEVIPGPYSLEWPLITEIRSLDVPFELRDIVVP